MLQKEEFVFFNYTMNILCQKAVEVPLRLYNKFDPSVFIIGVVAFSQGIQHLADLSLQYMFKDDFKVSPAHMGMYMSYISFPWIIKPLWGLFTDSKPLFGYRRKSYLILFGLLGSSGWVLLAFYGLNNMYHALGLLLLIQFSVCFTNVVGEAILVEKAGNKNRTEQQSEENDKEFQKGASRNVSIFFGIRAAGSLISAYSSGALLVYISKKEIFLITAIFPFTLAISALFLHEKKIVAADANDRRVNSKQCLVDFWTFFQNPLIYKPVVLIFCFMMAPSSSAIMFFFYTQVLGFTPQFLGSLKFMYAIGTIAGVLLYNTWLRDISFKKIFPISAFFYYLCYQSLIILVTRKNVEWGINDKLFCIGDSVILQLVGEINLMPILVLACRMCPKNIEGTMYAMLMSTINFGSMLGAQFGALLLMGLGVSDKDYTNLWLFVFISGLFILLPLPWVYVVQEEDILKNRQVAQIANDNDEMERGNQRLSQQSPSRESKVAEPADSEENQGLLSDQVTEATEAK